MMLIITATRIAVPITAKAIIIGCAAEDKYVRKTVSQRIQYFYTVTCTN